MKINSLEEKFKHLESLGFKTPKHCIIKIEDIPDFYQKVIEWRNSLDYDIDGLVLSIDNVEKMESLGVFSEKKKPKGQIALKFPPNINLTKIMGVDFSQKGIIDISMVALVEPVMIDGTEVKRASLKSYRWVQENNIGVGSVVEIVKGGDIIPKIVKAVAPSDTPFIYPKECIYCGGNIKNNGTDLYCGNNRCNAKIASRVSKFLKTLKIKGLSWKSLLKYSKVNITLEYFVSKNWNGIEEKIKQDRGISKVIWQKVRKQLEGY